MNRKRIVYFLSSTSKNIGGADHTLLMQAFLMRFTFVVTVVLPCDVLGGYNISFRKKCEEFGLKYKILKYDTAYRMKDINMVDYKEDAERIETFIDANGADLLHSVQINPAVEYIARKRQIPHLMNIYSLEEWEWKIPGADIFPEYVSCDSNFFLEKWKSYLKCSGSCVRVFDEIGLKRKGIKRKDAIVIGVVGAFFEYKNHLEVIRAVELEIQRGRKLQLIFAGNADTKYADRCREYIKEQCLQEAVSLLGMMDDMKIFYEQIDVFLCGSRRESFPSSIVEAISGGIPVISTPVAGVPEILTDRENAYITRGYGAEELAAALENFLQDDGNGKLQVILANGEETYRKYFSSEAVRAQLSELYNDMWNGNRKPDKLQIWNDISGKLAAMEDQMVKRLREAGMNCDDVMRMHKRLLFFYRIKERLAARECYIWGAGKWGNITRVMLECLVEDSHIKGFVDSKRKEPMQGIPVVSKEEMDIGEDTVVLISFVQGQEEAVRYLNGRDLKVMENIFIIA